MNKCILLIILSVAILSCEQFNQVVHKFDSGESDAKDSLSQMNSERLKLYPGLLTNVDQLRMRKYPDIKSQVITTLNENSVLLSLEEQTDFSDVIGQHKAPWFHVMRIDGGEKGWVYGSPTFVTQLLERPLLDSLEMMAKGIQYFELVSKNDIESLTGTSLTSTIPGTRFSGYYEFDAKGNPDVIDGALVLRARVFDQEEKTVKYQFCSINVRKGMPSTTMTCQPVTDN